MNILLALSQMEVTGAEVYAATLADALIQKGNSVWIVSDTFSTPTRANILCLRFNQRTFLHRLRHITALVKIIHRYNIDIVHAHSRASGWVAFFAAKIARIPFVSTVHGRQPTHISRKLLPAFGRKIFAVCENIASHLQRDYKLPLDRLKVLRNGIPSHFSPDSVPVNQHQKTVAIIGRLSGPKGEVACHILNILMEQERNLRIICVGGKEIPSKFEKYIGKVEFIGHVSDVSSWMKKSDLVIGSGRVAVEALMLGIPTFAIGEALCVGYIEESTIEEGLASNFGDISEHEGQFFDWDDVRRKLIATLDGLLPVPHNVYALIKQEYSIQAIADEIEREYQTELVYYHSREIPILLYHRVVRDSKEAGRHGIYVSAEQFETHLAILQKKGFETITFADLPAINRFDRKKKYVILTFDDGYEDNYTLAFPLLKKYGAKAVIYILTDRFNNIWDAGDGEPLLPLMNKHQILEMQDYGIEFGSHGKTHADLTAISTEEAWLEIAESRSTLEEKLGRKVISFAYPYGRLNHELKTFVQSAGYLYGIATDTGSFCFHDDMFHIRRIGIFPNTNAWKFTRKISGNYPLKRMSIQGEKAVKLTRTFGTNRSEDIKIKDGISQNV